MNNGKATNNNIISKLLTGLILALLLTAAFFGYRWLNAPEREAERFYRLIGKGEFLQAYDMIAESLPESEFLTVEKFGAVVCANPAVSTGKHTVIAVGTEETGADPASDNLYDVYSVNKKTGDEALYRFEIRDTGRRRFGILREWQLIPQDLYVKEAELEGVEGVNPAVDGIRLEESNCRIEEGNGLRRFYVPYLFAGRHEIRTEYFDNIFLPSEQVSEIWYDGGFMCIQIPELTEDVKTELKEKMLDLWDYALYLAILENQVSMLTQSFPDYDESVAKFQDESYEFGKQCVDLLWREPQQKSTELTWELDAFRHRIFPGDGQNGKMLIAESVTDGSGNEFTRGCNPEITDCAVRSGVYLVRLKAKANPVYTGLGHFLEIYLNGMNTEYWLELKHQNEEECLMTFAWYQGKWYLQDFGHQILSTEELEKEIYQEEDLSTEEALPKEAAE